MYQFRVMAETQMGEQIGLVGSTARLGAWDVKKFVPLQTNGERYPIWWTAEIEPGAVPKGADRIEYKYIRIARNGSASWESDATNRWVPLQRGDSPKIIVEDGWYGMPQPFPFGYYETPPAEPQTRRSKGRTIIVVGSSVAAGFSAWLCRGWAWHLAKVLKKRGDSLINAAVPGANVTTTLKRLPAVLAEHRPNIVIIALSLGNEGLASCAPHERRAVQRRFESGLQSLLYMTRRSGARPILAGVYPNGCYTAEHAWLLRDTHARLKRWDTPMLDWLDALDNGNGQWKAGISFDPAHPNTEGHRLMFETIDLSLFDARRYRVAASANDDTADQLIYRDESGFRLYASGRERRIYVENASPYHYAMTPDWQELNCAIQEKARLEAGIYIAESPGSGVSPSLAITAAGRLESIADVPPTPRVEYRPAVDFFAPERAEILFYDGHVGILRESDETVRFLNETYATYKIHPIWNEVREIMRRMPQGVYWDPDCPDMPFRTMIIGASGLESRIKLPPRSSFIVRWQCALSDVRRIAILPLGNRCAIRMILNKLEYEGPCYPFDLTRAMDTWAVADLVANNFEGMCHPEHLCYVHDERRIYHTRISGLSFAHEIEPGDDPIQNVYPVYQRMQARYRGRAERFLHALTHCDEALFIRTGLTDANSAAYLRDKLAWKCGSKPFRLVLISPQSSEEFRHLPNVLHYNVEFNPDTMYDDLGYWMHCTHIMGGILDSLGVSTRNLFWCPPKSQKYEASDFPKLPGEPSRGASSWTDGYESVASFNNEPIVEKEYAA